jgi:enoyl-CoA hydratase/carnithine racemase
MAFTRTAIKGPIAYVTLDHPKGNRINFEMRVELRDAFGAISESDARVLVVRAEGPDFSLGGDVRDWPGIPAATLRPKVEVFATALDLLERLNIPTIAAIQGNCMGGGFELALSCDMIVAARTARFAFPEARLGLLTLQGGMMQIADCVGRAKAAELVFLSEPIAAEQMAQWNVVNRVVEDADLVAEIDRFAARLAAGPPEAYAATKQMLRLWSERGTAEAKASLYDISMPLFDRADVQTALRNAAAAAKAGEPFPKAVFGSYQV